MKKYFTVPAIICACILVISFLIVSWKNGERTRTFVEVIDVGRDNPAGLQKEINASIKRNENSNLSSIEYSAGTIAGGTYYSAVLIYKEN